MAFGKALENPYQDPNVKYIRPKDAKGKCPSTILLGDPFKSPFKLRCHLVEGHKEDHEFAAKSADHEKVNPVVGSFRAVNWRHKFYKIVWKD
jgi:hypothetical protein